MALTWMQSLAQHVRNVRRKYPEEKLIIIFSLSTVLMVDEQMDGSIANLDAFQSRSGVMEVMRWFQIQSEATVGIATKQPETDRPILLHILNRLGQQYRVQFSDEQLYFYPQAQVSGNEHRGLASIQYFEQKGYRVLAVVDSDMRNLEMILETIDDDTDILLLHMATHPLSNDNPLPAGIVAGSTYDITDLIPESLLPVGVDLVWHGINDVPNLRQFLSSDIQWGECDIHYDPAAGELVLHHDPLPLHKKFGHRLLTLDTLMRQMKERNRSIKLDLKQGGAVIDQSLDLVEKYGFTDDQMWFNGNVERLEEAGFRKLAAAHPKAVLQAPIDSLSGLIESNPSKAHELLQSFQDWGMNRFSISWQTSNLPRFLDYMDQWALEVNIYGVVDLTTFLQAVLLLPRSVTCDFNFPKWYYYGRGSGENGEYYEYTIRKM